MIKMRWPIGLTAVFLVLLHLNIWLHSMEHGYGNVKEHANFVWTLALWTVVFGVASVLTWVAWMDD